MCVILVGENWLKSRENMQNQDNIEYILGKLEDKDENKEDKDGNRIDDIDNDALRNRYKDFKKKYDETISTVLKSFDRSKQKEPNIESVISNIKECTSKCIQNTGSLIWDSSIRDKMPDILANVLAVWTH